MGKFLTKIFLFIIPLVAIFVGLEYIARSTPNSYKYKEEYMVNYGDSINTIILGSSHSFYGINPQYLENKSFNLANVSQDLKFDLYLLNRYIDKCSNLKTLIVPISYFTLFETPLDKGNEQFRVKFYEHYMGYSDTLLNKFKKLEIYNIKIFQEKIGKYFKGVCCNEVDYGYDSNGWATNYNTSKIGNKVESDAIKTITRHTPKNDTYFKENLESLNQIAELCHKRNIRLFFITAPTLPAYYNKIDSKKWSFTQSVINNVCIKYNASYLNYLEDERFEESDFFDVDHLCHKGAEKFSSILKDEIFE